MTGRASRPRRHGGSVRTERVGPAQLVTATTTATAATAAGGGRHRSNSAKTHRRWSVGAACLVAVVATTAVLFGGGGSGRSSSPSAASAPIAVSPPSGRSTGTSTATRGLSTTGVGHISATPTLQVPVDAPSTGPSAGTPVKLLVGKIGVDTSLYPLHLLADGSLQAPPKWQQAGWFADGVRPGDTGPAVIAGHVDSHLGPAVFYRLTKLAVGDDVAVVSSAGRTLHFTVTRKQEFLKAAFPTDEVYGPTPLAELKLITCTGDFDRSKRSYVDNLIVTAVLDADR